MLHVANGHSTTGLIELSGLPGRTMVWCDPLNDGPVPVDVPDEELVRVRAAFLAGSPDQVERVAADLSEWRAAIDDQGSYDELVLWFEHDLFDQLNLIQLLSYLGSRGVSKPVTMVTIDSFPGRPDFKGLGELEPSDLDTLFAARQPIGSEQLALAARAWSAYRSPDPRAIETLLATDTAALPFLAPALGRHLEEFPSDTDGLSRSERRLMEQASDRPVELHQALSRMHDGETAFHITDLSFFDRANDLATCRAAAGADQPERSQRQRHAGRHARTHQAGPRGAARPRRSASAVRYRSLARRRSSRGPRTRLAMEPAPRTVDRSVTALRSRQDCSND